MRKKILNQEKGIALTMAIIIMLALFLIATAYFISTRNEISNALLNKAKTKAIEVAAVGAERAIWDIQQRLDNNPNWQPDQDEIQLLNTDYNYFRNPDRNPDNYAQKCVQVGSTQAGVTSGSVGGIGSQVYAVKMRKEDNPDTPNVVEWAIYSLGIERTTADILSQMNMQAVKIVVQLGQTQQVDFQTMYNGEGDEEVNWYQNASIQIDGRGDTAKGYTANSINDKNKGTNPGGEYYHDYEPSPTDGINKKSQFILSYPQKTPPLKLPDTTGIDITKKQVTPPPFPKIKFSEITADYTAEQLLIPDPTTGRSKWIKVPEVQNGITYYHYEFNTTIPGVGGFAVAFVNSITDNPNTPQADSMQDEINRLNGTYGLDLKSNAFHSTTTYEDVNGDGFVVIKIPADGYSLRVGNFVTGSRRADTVIFPNTHVIIVAEGSGSNEYSSSGGDNKLNTNVSIEFRSEIITPPYLHVQSADIDPTSVNYYVDANGDPKVGPATTTVSKIEGKQVVKKVVPVVQPEDPMLGTLDIFAKNDVIFGHPPYTGSTNKFRGMVYSSMGKVNIAKDMFLQGVICGKRGVYWEDEGSLKAETYYAYGNGIDTAIWHEDPLRRIRDENGRDPSLRVNWLEGAGVGTGNLQIISWENVGKLKDTFGN